MSMTRIIEGINISKLLLNKSVVWKGGIIHINNKPYYRLLPDKEYIVKTENIKNMYTLSINNRIIYHNPHIFQYSLHIKIDEKFIYKEKK